MADFLRGAQHTKGFRRLGRPGTAKELFDDSFVYIDEKAMDMITPDGIERRIYIMRGHKVMLDSDLAGIYGVTTKRLNEQVRRNRRRFPDDFMFQLTAEEIGVLRSQNATLKTSQGKHRKYLPYVFTEHGAVMLSGVLNTPVAVEASVQIARAFVKLREILSSNRELATRLDAMERHLVSHDEALGGHAEHLRALFRAIRRLMEPRRRRKSQIGFKLSDGSGLRQAG